MIALAQIKDSVARGAKLLDERVPNWAHKIKFGGRNGLNLRSGCNCVLGQLFGDYWIGSDELKLEDGGDPFGFDLPPNCDWESFVDPARKFWRAEVRARLAADAGGTPA